jgi:uncharacterized protein YndB with AHSA1/START domain
MTKLRLEREINTTPEKLWHLLWTNETYREWASLFAEGSDAITDWQQGSRVLFTDGKNNGMVAEIAERREPEYMAFRHLGMMKDGVEDLESEEVKKWAGAIESYTLEPTGENKTRLTMEMDIAEDYHEYFEKIWPLVFDKISQMAES